MIITDTDATASAYADATIERLQRQCPTPITDATREHVWWKAYRMSLDAQIARAARRSES